MSYPIRLERDTQIIDWATKLSGFSTVQSLLSDTAWEARSSGVINSAFGTAYNIGGKSMNAGSVRCLGVHMEGPQEGEDYTVYAISVNAMSWAAGVRPVLFMGESPASPTVDSVISDVRIIGTCDTSGDIGGTLQKDFSVVVKENTAERAVFFGVAMASGLAASSDYMHGRISVRRLVKIEPTVLDTTKL